MIEMQAARWQRMIVLAHLVLAVLYGAVIPPYEAHDETGHFAYIHHIVSTGRLPGRNDPTEAFLDQSHQPPLYYLVAGALTFWAGHDSYAPPVRNVFAFDGSNRRGSRILLRDPGEAFPWRGAILGLHMARWVSALLSALMLALIARSAALLFPDRPAAAVLSTAIAAFNPQVIFMAAMVNNDVMVSLAGAAVAFFTLRIALAEKTHWRLFVPLGATLGLSLMSKNSALALIGFVALALIFVARRKRWPARQLVRHALITFVSAAVIAAPHYLLNLQRFGRLLPDRSADTPVITQQNLIVEGVGVALRDAWLPRIFVNAFRTFWGTFGWGNVQQSELAYALYALMFVAGFAGCVLAARTADRRLRDGLILLAGLAAALMILPTYRAIAYQDPSLLPGRYLMPSLCAYACVLGLGLTTLSRRALALGPVLGAYALAIPALIFAPAYLPSLKGDDRAAQALLTFGNAAQVTAIDARTVYLPDREGDRQYARVRLTWRALRATAQPYAFGLTVLGRDHEALGSINIYPQRGNYPSTMWEAGQTFTDEYDILLEKPCAQLPALGRVDVSVFRVEAEAAGGAMRIVDKLPALDAAGAAVTPVLGRFKIEAPPAPYPIHWQEPRARFDGTIGLRDVTAPASATAGQPLEVAINFDVLRRMDRSATVFVHALDASGALVAQDDHAPFGGAYPSNLWDPGDCARERFSLNVPATFSGTVTLYTGWYDADGRLRATTAFDPAKPEFDNGLVNVGTVSVEKSR